MKNLIIYLSKDHKFPVEAERLVKIQIENSYRLEWGSKDILLVTNFPFEYMGVKAIVMGDEHYCVPRPRSINTSILPALIDKGTIGDDIHWNHDVDAFEINPISGEELELDGYDAGLTDYGWKSRLCMGSFFLKPTARDFFAKTIEGIFSDIEDEDVVQSVLDQNPEMAKRIKRMNITYNIGQRKVPENIERATKPPKVFHFHPDKPGKLDIFRPYMPQELLDIFAKHGYA
jgi:hypothetical protein